MFIISELLRPPIKLLERVLLVTGGGQMACCTKPIFLNENGKLQWHCDFIWYPQTKNEVSNRKFEPRFVCICVFSCLHLNLNRSCSPYCRLLQKKKRLSGVKVRLTLNHVTCGCSIVHTASDSCSDRTGLNYKYHPSPRLSQGARFTGLGRKNVHFRPRACSVLYTSYLATPAGPRIAVVTEVGQKERRWRLATRDTICK